MKSISEIIVSVGIWTYNHEKFIAKALDSVLMQKTTFPYKICLGEDYSTDNTRAICLQYSEKYPEKIEIYLNDKNDIYKNVRTVFNACFNSGAKYVALLDGDDYWTDELKLQKQVDALEANPECTICGHNTRWQSEDGKTLNSSAFPAEHPERNVFGLEDLLKHYLFHTSSIMVRNNLFATFPTRFEDIWVGDWAFMVLNAMHGKIYYIHEIMSVYNINNKSAWHFTSLINKEKYRIRACHIIDKHLLFKYHKILSENIAARYYSLAYAYKQNGNTINAIVCIIKCLFLAPYDAYYQRTPKFYFATLFELMLPGLYGWVKRISAKK